jgi:hypothetical protein
MDCTSNQRFFPPSPGQSLSPPVRRKGEHTPFGVGIQQNLWTRTLSSPPWFRSSNLCLVAHYASSWVRLSHSSTNWMRIPQIQIPSQTQKVPGIQTLSMWQRIFVVANKQTTNSRLEVVVCTMLEERERLQSSRREWWIEPELKGRKLSCNSDIEEDKAISRGFWWIYACEVAAMAMPTYSLKYPGANGLTLSCSQVILALSLS